MSGRITLRTTAEIIKTVNEVNSNLGRAYNRGSESPAMTAAVLHLCDLLVELIQLVESHDHPHYPHQHVLRTPALASPGDII